MGHNETDRHVSDQAGLISFASPAQMTRCITALVSMRLALTLREKDAAVLAVSGGSTPRALYEALSAMPLEWSKVTVVLVDERWVDEGETGSNASFVRETLLQGEAATAKFISLKTSHPTAADGQHAVNERLVGLPAPDVVVLGMGNDGHTASWFPHAEGLEVALAPEAPKAVAVTARKSDVTGDFLQRMTLSLSFLQQAALTILMMQGDTKRSTYDKACEGGDVDDMPVRALLAEPPAQFWPCWTK